MKYLAMLKSEKALPDELPKLSKAPFGTFDSTPSRHISENQSEQRKNPTRARGYGCASCGNKIYTAVQVWDVSELPLGSPWSHERKPVTYWQCEGCGSVYEIIGGSRGPVFIN